MVKNIKQNIVVICSILLFVIQILFSYNLRKQRPQIQNTPFPPTKLAIKALSLGDEQFLFRYYVLSLQNAGDKIGFVTSLKHHNYQRLYGWFAALDDFDKNSKITPSIAANYYGASVDENNARWVIKYLIENGTKNIQTNWRSLTYAAYLAINIKDYDLVTKATLPIATSNDSKIPLWAKTLGVFYLQSDIDKSFDKLTANQQKTIVCSSWKFLQALELDIQNKTQDEAFLQQDPIFTTIIYSRLEKIKQNKQMLVKC